MKQLHFEGFLQRNIRFYKYERLYGKCMVILKKGTGENKGNKRPHVSLKLSSSTSFFLEILFYFVKDYNEKFLIKQRRNCTFAVFLLFPNAIYEFR